MTSFKRVWFCFMVYYFIKGECSEEDDLKRDYDIDGFENRQDTKDSSYDVKDDNPLIANNKRQDLIGDNYFAYDFSYTGNDKIDNYMDMNFVPRDLPRDKNIEPSLKEYQDEKNAGDMTQLLGINIHHKQPEKYNDFGRRFVPQYPYLERDFPKLPKKHELKQDYLTPVKAPPEFVLAVAKESELMEAAKPFNPSDYLIHDNILRNGDYWNAVWKEDVLDPSKALRSVTNENLFPKLETVQAKIMPGTKLYQLISVLKQISPRLLYVINKE